MPNVTITNCAEQRGRERAARPLRTQVGTHGPPDPRVGVLEWGTHGVGVLRVLEGCLRWGDGCCTPAGGCTCSRACS